MGRKTQITKDIILETALQMLIRDGYASITVKTLAAEIGCSTQPIVWHFENMQGFRKAFLEYCILNEFTFFCRCNRFIFVCCNKLPYLVKITEYTINTTIIPL